MGKENLGENRAKGKLTRENELKAWDLAAETEQSAMYYVAYSGRNWTKEEFFKSGAEEVEEYTADFFREMNFDPAGKCMLDIGCGMGRMARAFSAIFGEAHGVDFSPKMIKIAEELNKDKPNLHVKVNKGVDLSIYKDGFF